MAKVGLRVEREAGLTFVWQNQQECNLGEMIKLAEEKYSGLERESMVAVH